MGSSGRRGRTPEGGLKEEMDSSANFQSEAGLLDGKVFILCSSFTAFRGAESSLLLVSGIIVKVVKVFEKKEVK